jgi:hypothetical protein
VSITLKTAKKLRGVFVDEEVVIYLKDMNVVTVDENQGEMKISAMIQGYVIDIDENFYYLGLPDGQITRTVSHETAQMVELLALNEANEFMGDGVVGPDEDIH